AKDQIGYRKSEEKIHLVMAHSIQPDGSLQDVAANAAFIQTPQAEGDQSLYTDFGELVLLYPNVKPGTIAESIVVIEQPTPRIEGQFARVLGLAWYWPQLRERDVVDPPASLAARLKITPLGQGTPAVQRDEQGGRVRLAWQRDDIPASQWEPNHAPSTEV